jgi:hypothetical protein
MPRTYRKINFYQLSLHSGNDVRQGIQIAFDTLTRLNNEQNSARYTATSRGLRLGLPRFTQERGHYYHGCFYLVTEEFPDTIHKTTGRTSTIEGEEDDEVGLLEETHFVIRCDPEMDVILGLESTQRPSLNDITTYLNRLLVEADTDTDTEEFFRLHPIFAFDLASLDQRMDEVASFRVKVHSDDIADVRQEYPALGDTLDASRNFAQTEFVDIDFSISHTPGHQRMSSDGIKARIRELLRVLTRKPETKRNFQKLEVRAQDTQEGYRLTLFDLIQEQVALRVLVERRRPRSKYFNSIQLYSEIREKIRQTFGGDSPGRA